MMRAARLRRSRDIATVRASGRALRRSAFVARVLPRDGSATRIAFVASRSIGGAVVRNRARRRVREAFRRQLATSDARGLDILVTVRPEAVAASFGTLVADAGSLLREAAR